MIIYKVKKFQAGGRQLSQQDSVNLIKNRIIGFEAHMGGPGGSDLPQYKTDPSYRAYLETLSKDPLLKIFPTALEKSAALDFMYNTGKDPRVYLLDAYLQKTTGQGLENRGSYNKRKFTKDVTSGSIDWTPELESKLNSLWQQHGKNIMSLPTNDRTILLNTGRDNYYKSINKKPDGSPSDNYFETWGPRIWNTNKIEPYVEDQSTFVNPAFQRLQQQDIIKNKKPYIQYSQDAPGVGQYWYIDPEKGDTIPINKALLNTKYKGVKVLNIPYKK